MLDIIEAGPRLLDQIQAIVERENAPVYLSPLEATRLLAPIPVPPQIRDFTVFPLHAAQAPVGMRKLAARLAGESEPDIAAGEVAAIYREQPIYYLTNRFSVAGHEDVVTWPSYSTFMDFELEF